MKIQPQRPSSKAKRTFKVLRKTGDIPATAETSEFEALGRGVASPDSYNAFHVDHSYGYISTGGDEFIRVLGNEEKGWKVYEANRKWEELDDVAPHNGLPRIPDGETYKTMIRNWFTLHDIYSVNDSSQDLEKAKTVVDEITRRGTLDVAIIGAMLRPEEEQEPDEASALTLINYIQGASPATPIVHALAPKHISGKQFDRFEYEAGNTVHILNKPFDKGEFYHHMGEVAPWAGLVPDRRSK